MTRRYLPGTNVLETTFAAAGGSVRLTDALTLPGAGLTPWRELVRSVEGVAGSVPLRWRVEPRFGYGIDRTRIERRGAVPVATAGRDAVAVLSWEAGEPELAAGAVTGRFTASEGSRSAIVLAAAHEEPLVFPARDDVVARLEGTAAAWREWADGREYDGPWHEAVLRSALAQAPRLRPLRRDRRGSDHLAPGGDRRRAQLGLPLRLAARRVVRAAGPARARLRSRVACVLLVAPARLAADPSADPRSLPPRRPVRHRREEPRPRRLPRLAAGPGRQRSSGADPARRLRRAARSLGPLRRACRARPRSGPAPGRGRRLRLRVLGAAGCGDLGDARRADPLHAVEDAVRGRARPRPRACRTGTDPDRRAAIWRRERDRIREFVETRC